MKIGIDARFLTHPQHGGFKTYTECLVEALRRVDRENEYVLYVDRPSAVSCEAPEDRGFTLRSVGRAVSALGMPWREQVLLPLWARRDRLDLFHSPCLSAPLCLPCQLVLTVHDMIWHRSNASVEPAALGVRQRMLHEYYRQVTSRAVRRAAAVLTVSEASKSEIVTLLGVSANRVFVTYEAVRPGFAAAHEGWQADAIRRKYDLPGEFVMAIGAADPRKNTAALVDAYRLLPPGLREKYPLLVMWTHPSLAEDLRRRVERHGLNGQVRFRRLTASNEEMALLYKSASVFAFPSRSEGFGLPPLEAMACGVPVVAARNSSMPEVLGDAAWYVDAEDPGAIAAGMARVLTDASTRAALRESGLRRAALFSWDCCARETLSVYRMVLGLSSAGDLTTAGAMSGPLQQR